MIGDRRALAQALDNLIVNAIEHGGPTIVVEARRRGGRLRISVVDSGRGPRPRSRREQPGRGDRPALGRRPPRPRPARRAPGRRRARRPLRPAPLASAGSLAVLELPLAGDRTAPTGRMSRRGAGGRLLRRWRCSRRPAAAAIADGYGSSVARGYGPLRPVVVARAPSLRRRPADRARARSPRALEVRRVPARFVPPGALAVPGEALGLVPRAPLPAGSYLLAAQLRPPRPRRRRPGLAGGRRPVEIAVSGADALLAPAAPAGGARVDVVVTTEPSGPGPGRTYVAAAGGAAAGARARAPTARARAAPRRRRWG